MRPRAFSVATHFSEGSASQKEWNTSASVSGPSSGTTSHASSESKLHQDQKTISTESG